MGTVYYEDNSISNKDKDAILLQFHESYEVPDQGSSSDRIEGSDNVNVENRSSNSSTFLSLPFYQKYFNVNTEDVLRKIKGSLLPNLTMNYYESQIKARPDLYGPVWVCLTLAFSVAIGSNFLDYVSSSSSDPQHPWKYGFGIITNALFVVLIYSWVVPFVLWSLCKWYLSSQVAISALELICTYGYALVIYIPLSILWILYIPYLQWIFLIFGATSSGIVLISTMQPMSSKENYTLAATIVALHILFSVFLFFYFFHVK